MSQSDDAAAAYELRFEERGVRVVVRRAVSVELFQEIVDAMVIDPRFQPHMPALWDMRESSGFASLSAAELVRMVGISRRARASSTPYRVAMLAARDADFGVARMLGGSVSDREPLELGVFRDPEEAERWLFGGDDA